MYVTTFYSFKGGVGRTMALVNAAVELATRGRRVLAVDFDLEAPGLDTFDVLRPRKKIPGIIEFVLEYLDSGRAPAIEKFIGEAPGAGDGRLWVMPSGARQSMYATNLGRIDWGELYDRHDGYLLFEDIREQWKRVVEPDYVLIDSRTGYTDTGGICTRQLPDAVAILFFPNEQNLQGLDKVVQDIRSEASGPRKKEIELHFVMSNVPDLDDEDSILGDKIDAFRQRLGFTHEPAVVHRYDSLSLLNQVVFTKDRPKSRLAKEYHDVVREIVARNLDDRDGALDYIRQASHRWRRPRIHESPEEMVNKLQKIEDAHPDDGEVLFNLGMFYEHDRRLDRAASLFDRAIEAGYDEPEVYLERARLRVDDHDETAACDDAWQVLQADSLPPPLVREAVRLALSGETGDVAQSMAVTSLDAAERIWLAHELQGSPREVEVAASILEPMVEDQRLSSERRASTRSVLALRYLGAGKSSDAAELLGRGGRDVEDMDIGDAFNFGMATWGATREVVAEPFARVVELDRSHRERDDANYLQCMAVAHWATGDMRAALDFLRQAREASDVERVSTFSCWRYYEAPAKAFGEDLDEIQALILGDRSRTPRFMAAAANEPRC